VTHVDAFYEIQTRHIVIPSLVSHETTVDEEDDATFARLARQRKHCQGIE
jgi:hypothetical protein